MRKTNRHSSLHLLFLSGIFGLFGLYATGSAHAQALPVADKASDISVFAGVGRVKTDYGKDTNKGVTAGFDFTRYFRRLPVVPSIELRGSYVPAPAVTEKSFTGGLRLSYPFHRFHPYGDFLAGGAELTFHPDPYPGYTSDRGRIYSFGGGIDVDVVRNIALMVDYQQQKWNLGQNIAFAPYGTDFTLSPKLLVIGVHYTIPFRTHNREGEVR
jgi:hypothetical protein